MAGTVRDWTMEGVMEYLRANGEDIKNLAKRGDKSATAVFRAYHDLMKKYSGIPCPKAAPEYLTLCDSLNDYFLREMQIKERIKLAEKFHHRVEDEKEGPGKILLLN